MIPVDTRILHSKHGFIERKVKGIVVFSSDGNSVDTS